MCVVDIGGEERKVRYKMDGRRVVSVCVMVARDSLLQGSLLQGSPGSLLQGAVSAGFSSRVPFPILSCSFLAPLQRREYDEKIF